MSNQPDNENTDAILAKVCNTPDPELPELKELKQRKLDVSSIISHARGFQSGESVLPFIPLQ